eukprot:768532-Pelagomonas_calceolata.AAC.3
MSHGGKRAAAGEWANRHGHKGIHGQAASARGINGQAQAIDKDGQGGMGNRHSWDSKGGACWHTWTSRHG